MNFYCRWNDVKSKRWKQNALATKLSENETAKKSSKLFLLLGFFGGDSLEGRRGIVKLKNKSRLDGQLQQWNSQYTLSMCIHVWLVSGFTSLNSIK